MSQPHDLPSARPRPTRTTALLMGLVIAATVMAACGSDEQPRQPVTTASVVDGRQGAGEDGSNTNTNGGDTGDSMESTSTMAAGSPDTQERIGDQSPGGGDSNGLPDGSTGP